MSDWSTPHPNKCHYLAEDATDLCLKPTSVSAYYTEGRKDFIGNICIDHALNSLELKIDWELRDRWTGEAFDPTSKIGEQR